MTIQEEILQLKQEKDAVILAHYYVRPEIQEIADYVGDSFYLSQIATKLKEQVIVFCGVSFMGESAKILNPEKTILMPDLNADCPMAHMADSDTILEMRHKYEDLAVVCYINSDATLKELSDVCVTSSNAVNIVKALPQKNIYFIPDRNLAQYIAKKVPEKNFILHAGYCPIHDCIQVSEIKEQKTEHPNAKILAHPECNPTILEMADYIGSTSGIIAFAKQDSATEFIICTEEGVTYALKQDNPTKKFFYPKTTPVCTDMKKISLEKILHVLRTGDGEIQIEHQFKERAKKPLEKMLELGTK